ncbi:hypothetical protein [Sphingorhabdus contaminans]|uniref:hypothetical protein n=1 Tax=Sphingorhabdus contaminans TaxID=1343899 RepID=UPI003D2D38A3
MLAKTLISGFIFATYYVLITILVSIGIIADHGAVYGIVITLPIVAIIAFRKLLLLSLKNALIIGVGWMTVFYLLFIGSTMLISSRI